ncbi:aldo/keto reductase [Flavobacterium sp.]|uniref:aldo/keto reductase n=1 Tax=Flavobacterium sp. TaxID=239 RepID=UPI002638DAC5|nr:aldo/keto reductase [Flavobacterium sp.]
MQYNTIEKAGIKVSNLSFGCMSLTDSSTGNDALIGKAIDAGITLFDTADLYEKGENEKLLGKAIKGRRKDVAISTKAGNRWRSDGSGWDWCPEKKYILKAADESLKRLQTDYIDIYLLHGGTVDDPSDDVIEAFERLKEQGKIRSYGISSIRPNVIRKYVSEYDIAAVMTQYSLLDRRPEEETLPLLQENNIAVLARGTVAGGLLAGKPAADYLDTDAKEISAIINKINTMLPNRDFTEKAYRYVMDSPAITTAVAGIRTAAHLQQALMAADATILAVQERQMLRDIWEGNKYVQQR